MQSCRLSQYSAILLWQRSTYFSDKLFEIIGRLENTKSYTRPYQEYPRWERDARIFRLLVWCIYIPGSYQSFEQLSQKADPKPLFNHHQQPCTCITSAIASNTNCFI